MNEFLALEYIDKVLSGKITTCSWVKFAVNRHVQDLKDSKGKDFPYYFDEKSAQRVIMFAQDQRHTKGEWAKQRLKLTLEPWQQFIIWVIFGWKRKGLNTRRFTKAYIEVARKNGKTMLAAVLANYCFFADGEEGAEIYFCATKRDQAKIGWSDANAQIQKNSALKNRTSTYKMSSTVIKTGTTSLMRPVGQDSDTEDGLSPSFVLIDEYHAHKSSDLLNVMQNGMGARSQPLMFIITTAGFDKNAPCYNEERMMVTGILDGSISPPPDEVFGIIYTLDEQDDWADEKVWIKSNPNLGVSVYPEFLKSQVRQAIASPSKQNDVKTKNFNIWTQAASRWIGAEVWDACGGEVPFLSGRVCTGAFDLSSTTDLTAWVLSFPPADSKIDARYTLLCRFFLPSDDLIDRERRDKVPYRLWAEQGYLTLTPGNVIDYSYIESQILKDAEEYDLQDIACDPYNAKQTILRLQDEGLELSLFRQGFISMSGPTKDFERKALSQELNHGDNPILRWMISCTEIGSDPAGNIKPIKPEMKKTGKRIDGVVASIMAIDRSSILFAETSPYEGRGVRAI